MNTTISIEDRTDGQRVQCHRCRINHTEGYTYTDWEYETLVFLCADCLDPYDSVYRGKAAWRHQDSAPTFPFEYGIPLTNDQGTV